MAKYHVNWRKQVRRCRAKDGECPFGSFYDVFDSRAEAIVYALDKMGSNRVMAEQSVNEFDDFAVGSKYQDMIDMTPPGQKERSYKKKNVFDHGRK